MTGRHNMSQRHLRAKPLIGSFLSHSRRDGKRDLASVKINGG
jgi:hypothetical protein